MAIILNINTAFETAYVILSSGEEIISEVISSSRKDHASFLEPSVKQICSAAHISLNNIDAVSVVNGPGSYTGLRVGLSSAKALCYALNKPLILLNTLDVMAYALKLQCPVKQRDILFSPLIDARRMEVYTGLYDQDLKLMKNYSVEVLDSNFLENERKIKNIVAGGNGILKLQGIIKDNKFLYIDLLYLSKPAVILAHEAFIGKRFSDIIYSEPFYLKPVYFKNK